MSLDSVVKMARSIQIKWFKNVNLNSLNKVYSFCKSLSKFIINLYGESFVQILICQIANKNKYNTTSVSPFDILFAIKLIEIECAYSNPTANNK